MSHRHDSYALLSRTAFLSLYLGDMGGKRRDENLEPGVGHVKAERISVRLCFYLPFFLILI